jgi:hypothetical protein
VGDETIEITAPGGWKGKAVGRHLWQVIVGLALGFFIWQSNIEHKDMLREIQIQTWLLSLPQDQRPLLIMPEGIKDRLPYGDKRR